MCSMMITAENGFGTGFGSNVMWFPYFRPCWGSMTYLGVARDSFPLHLTLPQVFATVATDPPLGLAHAQSVDSQASFVWGDLSVQCLSLLHILTFGSVIIRSEISQFRVFSV